MDQASGFGSDGRWEDKEGDVRSMCGGKKIDVSVKKKCLQHVKQKCCMKAVCVRISGKQKVARWLDDLGKLIKFRRNKISAFMFQRKPNMQTKSFPSRQKDGRSFMIIQQFACIPSSSRITDKQKVCPIAHSFTTLCTWHLTCVLRVFLWIFIGWIYPVADKLKVYG